MKVRIKFSKKGAVRYIGHLDVMRFFQKAMRRSEIDIAYTTGFSPHQIMTFAAPLGVGLESNGEYMDVVLNSMVSSKDVVERLNKVSCDGIRVLSAKVLPDDAGNAMATVAAAKYTVLFRDGRQPEINLEDAVKRFLSQEQILVSKETKKSTLEIDLKPGIYNLEAISDGLSMMVDASSSGNIKPSMVVNALVDMCGLSLPKNAFTVTREETYLNAGTVEAPRFEPLDYIGSEI
ncbi:MAG: DUF2344 domain-containing protein [Lachnospiraceae bacterium]|nr:DUF2344 domain-containing protein [Lachnospiraceae bacterium]